MKTGSELIETVREQKRTHDDEKKCLETVVDLLSLNQIGVSGTFFFIVFSIIDEIQSMVRLF